MNRYRKRMFSAIMLMLTAMLFSAVPQMISAAETTNATIAEGVYIGTVNVGGMTKEEAVNKITGYVDSMENTTFTLLANDNSMQLKGSSMGIEVDVDTAVEEAYAVARYGTLINRFKETKDLTQNNVTIELPLTIDMDNVAQYIILEQSNLEVQEIDNGLSLENGEFQVIYGTEGTKINLVNSVQNILDYLRRQYTPENPVIDLAVDIVEPGGSADELSLVQNLLGSYHTDYSSSTEGRAQNVRTAVSKINGTILYPGEEFSVYTAISPFTEENGYELAASYGNGVVTESFGGGVCQVSTTLYNAVIRAELEVTERYNHSMLVHYVEPSEDAAIASGLKDFKFVNTLEAPVYIEGYCYDGVIYFNVYGQETRPSNRTVSFESETVSKTDYETTFELDDTIAVGSYEISSPGYDGCVAKLWKIVSVDGVEESREEFNNSVYDLVDRKLLIGIQGATTDQYNSLVNAISSGDEDTVLQAVNNCKN